MADIFTKEKRSWVMSRIKGKNTSPELLVFRYLRRNKIYFQRHYTRAPGRPDIAIPSRKICVFVDGDFWHGRKFDPKNYRLNAFWKRKIMGNMERDIKNRKILRKDGWKVLRIWEFDLKTKRRERTLEKTAMFLKSGK